MQSKNNNIMLCYLSWSVVFSIEDDVVGDGDDDDGCTVFAGSSSITSSPIYIYSISSAYIISYILYFSSCNFMLMQRELESSF